MTAQPPFKSVLTEFTHEQPLSPDQTQALDVHNQAREAATQTSSFGRPCVVWDPHLAGLAQQWAEHLAARNKGLKHSTNEERPDQGENLYWMSGGGTLTAASQAWINECANYNGQEIGKGKMESYCHYTQIIWPSTTRVGIAAAQSRNGATFIVGRYSAPGNFYGRSAFTGQ